jgi:hypothetical protein
LGYNSPPGDCQPVDGVTTKTGMTTSVLDALNTRFDIFANGNSTCPAQGGGTCSPAVNTRKDLVCNSPGGSATCSGSWSRATNYYKLPTDSVTQTTCNNGGHCTTTTTNVTSERALTSTDTYPDMMGYPHDICQADVEGSGSNAGVCAIQGNGTWDRDAYFKVNYGWTAAGTGTTSWTANTGLSATAKRWDVYQWELGHQTVNVNGANKGIAVPQPAGGNNYGHGIPANGVAGVGAGATQADRRRISAAVLNCLALNAHGKTTNVPVTTWLDLFLVEPAIKRTGSGSALYTDSKDIYVEVIGTTTAAGNNAAGQVVRRDLPYLVK